MSIATEAIITWPTITHWIIEIVVVLGNHITDILSQDINIWHLYVTIISVFITVRGCFCRFMEYVFAITSYILYYTNKL